MKSLHIESHSDKTICHSVSPKEKEITQLYEQGARKNRMKHYLKGCLVWGVLGLATSVSAGPGDPMVAGNPANCVVVGPSQTLLGATDIDFVVTSNGVINFAGIPISINQSGRYDNSSSYVFVSVSAVRPTVGTPSPSSLNNFDWSSAGTYFITAGGGPGGETCVFEATHNGTSFTAFRVSSLARANNNATSVPTLTPVGLVVAVGGLLWFGRRRKLKISQS